MAASHSHQDGRGRPPRRATKYPYVDGSNLAPHTNDLGLVSAPANNNSNGRLQNVIGTALRFVIVLLSAVVLWAYVGRHPVVATVHVNSAATAAEEIPAAAVAAPPPPPPAVFTVAPPPPAAGSATSPHAAVPFAVPPTNAPHVIDDVAVVEVDANVVLQQQRKRQKNVARSAVVTHQRPIGELPSSATASGSPSPATTRTPQQQLASATARLVMNLAKDASAEAAYIRAINAATSSDVRSPAGIVGNTSSDLSPQSSSATSPPQPPLPFHTPRFPTDGSTSSIGPSMPSPPQMRAYYSDMILMVMTSPQREHLIYDIRQHYGRFFRYIVFVRGGPKPAVKKAGAAKKGAGADTDGSTEDPAKHDPANKPPFDVVYEATVTRGTSGSGFTLAGRPRRRIEAQRPVLDSLWVARRNDTASPTSSSSSQQQPSPTPTTTNNANNYTYVERIIGVNTPRDDLRKGMLGQGWYGIGHMPYLAMSEVMGRTELLGRMLRGEDPNHRITAADFESDWMRAFAPWLFPPHHPELRDEDQPSAGKPLTELPNIAGALFLGDDMLFMPWEPLRAGYDKRVPWVTDGHLMRAPPMMPSSSSSRRAGGGGASGLISADLPLPFDDPDPFYAPDASWRCRQMAMAAEAQILAGPPAGPPSFAFGGGASSSSSASSATTTSTFDNDKECRIPLAEAQTLTRMWRDRMKPMPYKQKLRQGRMFQVKKSWRSVFSTTTPRGIRETPSRHLADPHSPMVWHFDPSTNTTSVEYSYPKSGGGLSSSANGPSGFLSEWFDASQREQAANRVGLVINRYFPREYDSRKGDGSDTASAEAGGRRIAPLAASSLTISTPSTQQAGADDDPDAATAMFRRSEGGAIDTSCLARAEKVAEGNKDGRSTVSSRSPSVKDDLLPYYLSIIRGGGGAASSTRPFLPPFSRRAIIAATRRMPYHNIAEGSDIPLAYGPSSSNGKGHDAIEMVTEAYRAYGVGATKGSSGGAAAAVDGDEGLDESHRHKPITEADASSALLIGVMDAYYLPRHAFAAFIWLSHVGGYCDNFGEVAIPTYVYLLQIAYARQQQGGEGGGGGSGEAAVGSNRVGAGIPADGGASTAQRSMDISALPSASVVPPSAAALPPIDRFERLDAQYFWEGLAMHCNRYAYFLCADAELAAAAEMGRDNPTAAYEQFEGRFRTQGPYTRQQSVGLHRCRHDHAFVRRLLGSSREPEFADGVSRGSNVGEETWVAACRNRTLLHSMRDDPPKGGEEQVMRVARALKIPTQDVKASSKKARNTGDVRTHSSEGVLLGARWLLNSPFQQSDDLPMLDIDHRVFYKAADAKDVWAQ